jgi:hypothetical protein
MVTPGHRSLGAFNITTAGTQVGSAVEGLDGLLSMRLQARFALGSGGTTCKLYVQTSIDDGNTWGDFACIAFGNSNSESPVLNFTNLTPKTTQLLLTDGTLADDTAIDGIISSMVRCKVVTAGTYGGSTVLTVDADVS